MTDLLQTLLNGVAVGSLYALIALGYTMVYGILQFINFAHGDVFMIGAWSAYAVAAALGFTLAGGDPPGWSAVVVLLSSMGICAVLGFFIERFAYRPLRSAPRLNVLITAIGVSLLLQNTGQLRPVFGTQPQSMPALLPDTTLFQVAGVRVGVVDAAVVLLAVAMMVGLQWLVFRTRFGSAMRAVSHDHRIAALMGIRVDTVISLTFVVGSALAAAAGFLFAMKYSGLKQPADATWVLLGLKAFVAAVVGGIGNLQGAMLGGLLIGMVEMMGAAYLSPHLRDLYVFVLLIGVLLFRPTGIMGSTSVEKV